MTDDTSSRTNRAFNLLASSLDVVGKTPDPASTMTLLDAACHAIQFAYHEAENARDPRTTLDLGTAQQLFMRAVDQERGGDTAGSEILAASSLELSLTALRRSWEIKAGLCQPMTAGRINRRAAGVDDPTRLSRPDQSRRKAWIAALRARLPWALQENTRTQDLRVRVMNDEYASTLDWLKVPEDVQRRVDARRERNRQMEDQGRMEDCAPRASVTLLDDCAPVAGVTIH